ncbi:hypothetical protein BKA66DRAFT_153761 [Pyrenochaeta sp. MPI-SDFR-AT-0127]|nr:hypothetical protein BKA66DRAFT_153761 [Pyrenochaeta sp. MPI-SDFR-AT-0127]
MCILQDDLSDWHTEAASMRQVYASALCNIAATSAYNSSIGLSFRRDIDCSAPFEVLAPDQFGLTGKTQRLTKYLLYPRFSYCNDIENAPLNERAWVMQERLLSTRIMHFTSSGVYWECLTNISSDVYPESLPVPMLDASKTVHTKLLLLKNDTTGADTTNTSHVTQAWHNKQYDTWNLLCERYSLMKMTVPGDKLVAIQGIAQRLSQTNGDALACGLWKERLIPQLLWMVDPLRFTIGPPATHWRAPSWSWASQSRPMRHVAHIDCDNGQAKASVERIEVVAHASGQLKSALLTLRGRVVEAKLEFETAAIRFSNEDAVAHLTCKDKTVQLRGPFLDICDESPTPLHEQILCIGVYTDSCQSKVVDVVVPHTWELGVLVLEQYSLDPAKYQWIGIFLLDTKESRVYTSLESLEERSITII